MNGYEISDQIDEEKKMSEKAVRKWENEGGEVLEIAKLKTATGTQESQNDESEKLHCSRSATLLPEKN